MKENWIRGLKKESLMKIFHRIMNCPGAASGLNKEVSVKCGANFICALKYFPCSRSPFNFRITCCRILSTLFPYCIRKTNIATSTFWGTQPTAGKITNIKAYGVSQTAILVSIGQGVYLGDK